MLILLDLSQFLTPILISFGFPCTRSGNAMLIKICLVNVLPVYFIKTLVDPH